MNQDRLAALSLSIESEVMRSLNVDDLIHEFATAKAGKHTQLNITFYNSYMELNDDILYLKHAFVTCIIIFVTKYIFEL